MRYGNDEVGGPDESRIQPSLSLYRPPIFEFDMITFKCFYKECHYDYKMSIDPSKDGKVFYNPHFTMHRCLYAPGSESWLLIIDDSEKQSFTGGQKFSNEWIENLIQKKLIHNKCIIPL